MTFQTARQRAGQRWSGAGWAILAVAGVAAVSGCSNAAKTFGLERAPPDEFAVVRQVPLSMPPDFRLKPPQPGAARPQEPSTTDQAAGLLFGNAGAGRTRLASSGESAFLNQAGAGAAIPNIRGVLDQETSALLIADRGWVDSLIFWQKERPGYTLVNPAEEAQRLRQAAALGKPVTTGATPVIERKKRAPLEGIKDSIEGLFK
ncbi:MAG: DUF3035 domain-containing protein [Azospirillum sp.]|nr:DUF3035 domain-containing protein [Azospirillum sp.]